MVLYSCTELGLIIGLSSLLNLGYLVGAIAQIIYIADTLP